MKFVEVKLQQLKNDILDLTHIVKIQVQKTKQLIFNYDADLAFEIIKNTNRVEILKMQIEYDCRSFLALHNPVAIDLRLILSTLDICESLNKIGFHTSNISKTIKDLNIQLKKELLDDFKINKLFEGIIKMLYKIQNAYKNNDPFLAEKTFKKDRFINKIKKKSSHCALKCIEVHPDEVKNIIYLLDIVAYGETIGDHIKKISKGIVFYLEARMIKDRTQKSEII